MPRRGARAPEPFDYAGQWEEPEQELTLPSGKRVMVREPDLLALASKGGIPNHLVDLVERRIIPPEPGDKEKAAAGASPLPPGKRLLRAAEFAQYVDVVVVAACVRPEVVFADPGPGQVAVERFAPGDKFYIWQWSEGLIRPLESFRDDGERAAGAVPAAPDGAGVRDDAEPAAGAAPA